MLLSIQNLSFCWLDDLLFDQVTCELDRGQIVQLIGENGVGKTTLMQLMCGMIPHFNRGSRLTGDILIDGRSIFRDSIKSFFPDIAYIPCKNIDFFLIGDCLREDIILTQGILDLSDEFVEQHISTFRNFFPEVSPILNSRYSALSFGEKILSVSLIHLLQQSVLYLLDESIDAFIESAEERWFQYFEFLRTRKSTIIFTSHHDNHSDYLTWHIHDQKITF